MTPDAEAQPPLPPAPDGDPAPPPRRSDKWRRRLDRQFAAIARQSNAIGGPLRAVTRGGGAWVRVPAGAALVAGGVLSFLPVLGLWMLPAGLMILALDIPALRPAVSTGIIRLRRRIALWRRGVRRART